MTTIHHVFDVAAPLPRVYQAINSNAGLSSWWSTRVEGDYRVGGSIHFTFVDDFNPTMEITVLAEGKTVGWRCVGGHDPWAGGTFRFELADRPDGTRLRFWQQYSRELDDDSYGIYNFNWGYYMESLKLYLETGEGRPFNPRAQERLDA